MLIPLSRQWRLRVLSPRSGADAKERHMSHRAGVLAIVLVVLLVTPALAEDERPWWALSTSFNYSVGDYGTGKDTTFIYVPFTLGVTPLERLTVSLTVPYIRQTSQTVAPEIAPYVKIKFPTADDSRGLGTGEFDETLGVDLSKRFFDRWFGYVSLAYTFIGSPRGEDLRNTFGWSVGAAYAVIQPLSVFAFLDGATAISRGQADPLELRVGAEYKLIKALKLTGSVTRGLSNGSADWGVSAGLALRF